MENFHIRNPWTVINCFGFVFGLSILLIYFIVLGGRGDKIYRSPLWVRWTFAHVRTFSRRWGRQSPIGLSVKRRERNMFFCSFYLYLFWMKNIFYVLSCFSQFVVSDSAVNALHSANNMICFFFLSFFLLLI